METRTLSAPEIRMPLPNKSWTPVITNPTTLRALGKL
jgi:hypothetical protein